MPAGYSKTPLVKKLGLKGGMRAIAIAAPMDYSQLIGGLPDDIDFKKRLVGTFDFIHVFCTKRSEVEKHFPRCRDALDYAGTLWFSWPKQSSPLATSLREGDVRGIGLDTGLVDVKICAVDDDWSGLKFMWRTKDRR